MNTQLVTMFWWQMQVDAQFNSKLTESNHNVKEYRKRQKHKRRTEGIIPNSTECTYPENNYIHTIDLSERRISEHQPSEERIKLSMGRLANRRVSITAGNTRRNRNHDVHQKIVVINRSLDVKQQQSFQSQHRSKPNIENKYKTIEKKSNKTPLNEKYLENWLNTIILEVCNEETFDPTIQMSGLKKFSLDRNSLLSKGIHIQNLDRIYKSMFVYSLGFNDLLKQICGKNINLRMTIWKVYSLLLQYCAEGHFELMIAEIQRDKVRTMDKLKKQIQTRQKIIENNQQINQAKNLKIFKEIKYLKEENADLIHQKQVLMEEYKQTEQAFNEQVSLRLKFENKINQIHGIYSEVKSKHERLRIDHDRKVQHSEKLSTLCAEQKTEIMNYKTKNEEMKKHISSLEKLVSDQTQLLEKMEAQKIVQGTQSISQINNLKDFEKVIQQSQRNLKQNNLNLDNVCLLLKTEKEQHSKTRSLYQNTLQENDRLHITIKGQMKSLNELMLERRDFGIKSSEIEAECIIVKKKFQQKCEQLKEMQNNYKSSIETKEKSAIMYLHEKQLREKYELSLKQCFSSIQNMKEAKNLLEEDLEDCKKRMMITDELIQHKDQQIYKKSRDLQFMKEQNQTNIRLIKTQQSKISLLNEKLNSENQIWLKKYKKLKDEKERLDKLHAQATTLQQKLELQVQKYKNLFDSTHNSLKNEKFERSNLDLKYKQSLNAINDENQHIRSLNIEKSELNQEIITLQRKVKNMEFIFAEKQKRFQKDRKFWEEKIRQYQQAAKNKKVYIHPMIHEEALGLFYESQTNFNQYKKQKQKRLNQSEKRMNEAEKKYFSIKSTMKTELQKIKDDYQHLVQSKENQLAYADDKIFNLTEKNKELENKLIQQNYYKKNKLIDEKEDKYLKTIKQKTKIIESLTKQLEIIEDKFSHLKSQNIEINGQVERKNKEIKKLMIQILEERENIEKLEVEKLNLKRIAEEAEKSLQLASQKYHDDEKKKINNETINRNTKSRTEKPKWAYKKYEQPERTDDKRAQFAKKYKSSYVHYHK